MATIQIKHRWTSAVLFECESPGDIDSGLHVRHALEKATASKADLRDADLSYANLRGAYLGYANLSDANLSYADLRDANLSYANLRDADLSYADLRDADLSYANLRGAYLGYANLGYANMRGKKLVGDRPFITIGPIGSRSDYIQAWITDEGLMLRAGCFFGTKSEFEEKLSYKHGDNQHSQEYRAALVFIDAHVKLWTPSVKAVSKVEAVEVSA